MPFVKSDGPFAVKTLVDKLMVPSQSTVLLDATSTLLAPKANSPLETVKFPLISSSD